MQRIFGRSLILGIIILLIAVSASPASQQGFISSHTSSQAQYECVDRDGTIILSDTPCAEMRASNYEPSAATSHQNYFTDRPEGSGAYQRAVSALNGLQGASLSERLDAYFSAGNRGDASQQCHLYLHTEDVPSRRLIEIKRRDQYRCLVCSSREQLTIDHIQAIANGGDNSANNLALLCASCYTLKSELDRSLRWEREERCR